jgi:hypothetical protein
MRLGYFHFSNCINVFLFTFLTYRWRREERNSLTENASNAASEETTPLLAASLRQTPPVENHAYMSPR